MAAPLSRTSAEDWIAQPCVSFIEGEPASGGAAAHPIGSRRLPAARVRNEVRSMFINSSARLLEMGREPCRALHSPAPPHPVSGKRATPEILSYAGSWQHTRS